ncbi:hypothetical protein MRX96_018281 [Rhipicephalus microplus]
MPDNREVCHLLPAHKASVRRASVRVSGFHFHPRKLVRGQDLSGRTLSPSFGRCQPPSERVHGRTSYRPAILAPRLKNGSVLLLHPGQPVTSGGRWAILSFSPGK